MPFRSRYDHYFFSGHFSCWLVIGWVLTGGLPARAQPQQPAPGFRDRTAELGLQLANSQACWVDVDNDGWADLCAGGVVWRNNGGKSFTKLAEGFGEVVAADFDNDGFADLFSWSPILRVSQQGRQGLRADRDARTAASASPAARAGATSTATASSICTSEVTRTGTRGSRTRICY